jgi:hypothetical protein
VVKASFDQSTEDKYSKLGFIPYWSVKLDRCQSFCICCRAPMEGWAHPLESFTQRANALLKSVTVCCRNTVRNLSC